MESSGVISVSQNIGFQWNLKMKEIPLDSSLKETPEIIRSKIYHLKDIEDLYFFLELTPFGKIRISAKGHSKWSFKLKYALAIVNMRAFLVKDDIKKLGFLDQLKIDHLRNKEEVTFYCMILAEPRVGPEVTNVDLQEIAKEPLTTVDYIVIVHFKRGFHGEIPDFTFGNARWLLYNYGTCDDVLEILALEYLMKHISAENVTSVLGIALKMNIKVLEEASYDFLRNMK